MAETKVRIDLLTKDNYDTWKLHAEALLVKSDGWSYVDGSCRKPALTPGNEAAIKLWEIADRKARSDLILAISPSELKQVKGCETSREMWLKLESIFQSKGPARKATLLKRLTLTKMKEGEDVREHLNQFFDAVDKLSEMDLVVNDDLLAIMLLYSLPASFENFRCAIESRDELPKPEILKIKILEESEARKSKEADTIVDAMFAKKVSYSKKKNGKFKSDEESNKVKYVKPFRFKCHRCKKIGHKAADCRETERAGKAKESAFHNESTNKSPFHVDQ